jgi:orotidine-5'-phosphate decarboxylase
MRPTLIKNKLCIALDASDSKKAKNLVKKLADHVGYFKVGFQLFTSEGPKIIKIIQDQGGKVFLDLKFHDVPNTAARDPVMKVKLSYGIQYAPITVKRLEK